MIINGEQEGMEYTVVYTKVQSQNVRKKCGKHELYGCLCVLNVCAI
jgi:hypothetical protein